MLHLQPFLTWKSKWLSALSYSAALFLLASHNSSVLVEATFSIAATDSATKQVGAAGASCVANASIYDILYQGVPGHGVLMTQAKPAVPGTAVYQIGESMLLNDTDPAVIIETITDPSVDDAIVEQVLQCSDGKVVTYDEYKLRQYGVVDLMGRAAGYEDPTLKEYYYENCYIEGPGGFFNYTQEHKTGTEGAFTYSAQANIVTDTTVPALADNFVGQDGKVGCDLADRLYHAISSIPLMLQESIETDDPSKAAGDVRCFLIPAVANGMFLHVDNPDGSELVHIDVVGDADPFPEFQKQYEAWRSSNSCPEGSASSTPSTNAGGTPSGTESPTEKPSSGSTEKPSSGTSWMPSTTTAMWALVLVALHLFP